MAREVKARAADIEKFKQKAGGWGWKSVRVSGRATDKDAMSSGVAIFVRFGLALWLPSEAEHTVEDHRCVWAWVSGDGLPRIA
eukprot:8193069-Karenia_brevis.AAC.1